VEVESTIRPAKGRIAGFEGREGHRTPFAPSMILWDLVSARKPLRSGGVSCGVSRNLGDAFMEIGN